MADDEVRLAIPDGVESMGSSEAADRGALAELYFVAETKTDGLTCALLQHDRLFGWVWFRWVGTLCRWSYGSPLRCRRMRAFLHDNLSRCSPPPLFSVWPLALADGLLRASERVLGAVYGDLSEAGVLLEGALL